MMEALRTIDLTKLPAGAELVVRVLATSTGRFRLRAAIVRGGAEFEVKASVVLGDAVMPFSDVALDLGIFAGENLAHATLRAQDAGAGKEL